MRVRTSVRMLRGPVDMAPLIDVVLLLLIFFLLTSTFVFQPGIVVDPPSPGESKGGASDTRYVITATAGATPQIFFNDRVTDLAKLRAEMARLAQSEPRAVVVIRADRELRHGVVAQILDCVVQNGLSAVLASRASAPQL
ncbi:MAG: biopolymer transporter ExbD [Verrucomicrobia bacterium]|jgi:biopolymer transport protein ExbD|nr:biopolymer transporter ExbD [Verrucomicrobiota bacterium]